MTKPEAQAEASPAASDLTGADDHALVEAFVAGRSEAFDVLVDRHRRSVYQLCYRFVHDHEDASDLTQDVFVRAFRGLGSFKRDAAFATWLYRIGVNACLNRVAVKRPASEPIDAALHVDRRAPDPLEQVVRAERAAELRAAIARLPPKQQATLVLRVYQELTHEEIAQVLGSSVGAVKANFFHALGNLRRFLQTS
jgi:RNA polymerase sigma-70 factor (ECF subfamily)